MSDNWVTKQTLIQRVQNPDDATAWDDFVSYYQTFIAMVLNKSNIHINEKEDLVQDILVKVWKGLPNYEYRKEQAKFRTWLSILIRNTMLNYLDKLKRKNPGKVELNEQIILEVTESQIEKIIEEEWVSHLTQLAMKTVSEVFSGQAVDVFRMSLQGKGTKEISETLEITEESVFVLRSRVKSRLKKEIKKLRDEIEF